MLPYWFVAKKKIATILLGQIAQKITIISQDQCHQWIQFYVATEGELTRELSIITN